MNERDSYAELIWINVGTLKEDAESNLIHLRSLLMLSEPPFKNGQRNVDEEDAKSIQEDASQGAVGAINNASEEDESSCKH